MHKEQSGNLEVVKQWFHDLWERADAAAINALSQSDTVIHGAITDLGATRNDYSDMVMALNGLLNNITFEYITPLEQGDLVAAQLLVRAQAPRSNTPIRFSGQFIARVTEGKLAEITATIDYMKMFEQLGQIPEESLAICLTGERLVWAD